MIDLAKENKRLRANHKDAVATKRKTDSRLREALAGLQKIYDISGDANAPDYIALAAIREIAGDAFEKATSP